MGIVKNYEAWRAKRDTKSRIKEAAEEKRLSSYAAKARKDKARLDAIDKHRADIKAAREARFKHSWAGKAVATAGSIGESVQKSYATKPKRSYTKAPKRRKTGKKRKTTKRRRSTTRREPRERDMLSQMGF